MSQFCRFVRYAYWSINMLKQNTHGQLSVLKEDTKNKPLWFTFSKIRRTWSFYVVVLQWTAKKCTKIQNARAEPLFCSLNLSFVEVLVAVVVCLNSLIIGLTTKAEKPLAGVNSGGVVHTDGSDPSGSEL